MATNTNDESLIERVTFKASPALLAVLDRAAAARFSSRSDFIRGAVVERLRRENVIYSPASEMVGKTANSEGNL